MKNTLLAFFNPRQVWSKLQTARKITIYVAILGWPPCHRTARRFLQRTARSLGSRRLLRGQAECQRGFRRGNRPAAARHLARLRLGRCGQRASSWTSCASIHCSKAGNAGRACTEASQESLTVDRSDAPLGMVISSVPDLCSQAARQIFPAVAKTVSRSRNHLRAGASILQACRRLIRYVGHAASVQVRSSLRLSPPRFTPSEQKIGRF